LFENPGMPYTWGLLDSVPRMDSDRRERLVPIKGTPPDLADPPPGCRFQPRCAYSRDICATRQPELRPLDSSAVSHLARCWGTQHVEGGGWLIGIDRQTLRVQAQMRAGDD
jgi:oligopeptide/dipeptide ABC transporter ATP-binding protein